MECICHLLSAETIDNLKKQFGKPEIRTGDYGIDGTHLFFLVAEGSQFRKWLMNPSGTIGEGICWTEKEIQGEENIKILGNIFDLIKAQEKEGEDLERFDVSDKNGVLAFEATKQAGFNTVYLNIHCNSTGLFNIQQVATIHQKLGQIIATAKRKDC